MWNWRCSPWLLLPFPRSLRRSGTSWTLACCLPSRFSAADGAPGCPLRRMALGPSRCPAWQESGGRCARWSARRRLRWRRWPRSPRQVQVMAARGLQLGVGRPRRVLERRRVSADDRHGGHCPNCLRRPQRADVGTRLPTWCSSTEPGPREGRAGLRRRPVDAVHGPEFGCWKWPLGRCGSSPGDSVLGRPFVGGMGRGRRGGRGAGRAGRESRGRPRGSQVACGGPVESRPPPVVDAGVRERAAPSPTRKVAVAAGTVGRTGCRRARSGARLARIGSSRSRRIRSLGAAGAPPLVAAPDETQQPPEEGRGRWTGSRSSGGRPTPAPVNWW